MNTNTNDEIEINVMDRAKNEGEKQKGNSSCIRGGNNNDCAYGNGERSYNYRPWDV